MFIFREQEEKEHAVVSADSLSNVMLVLRQAVSRLPKLPVPPRRSRVRSFRETDDICRDAKHADAAPACRQKVFVYV